MRGATFAWLSTSPAVPVRWDLGHAGWSMEHAPDAASASAALPGVLDWRAASRLRDWHELAGRNRIVAVGVDSPRERARLLDAGLGDALSSHVAFVELGVRLARLRHGESSLPRSLRAGPVTLDLFHRDGRLDGRWLGMCGGSSIRPKPTRSPCMSRGSGLSWRFPPAAGWWKRIRKAATGWRPGPRPFPARRNAPDRPCRCRHAATGHGPPDGYQGAHNCGERFQHAVQRSRFHRPGR